MSVYAPPGRPGSPATVQARYDNWIGGEFVAPVEGRYFENASPVTGQVYCEVARSTAADIELALDAARQLEIPLPTAERADEVLERAEALGYERRDLAALFQVLEQMAGGDRASTS